MMQLLRGLICMILLNPFLRTPAIAQDTFQLAPPYLRYQSVFFKKEARLAIEFAQPGTQVRYAINNLGPTEKDAVYTKPIILKKNTDLVQARAFGPGFLPSESVWVRFFKKGLKIKSVSNTLPHERYPGNGKRTLIDGQGGFSSHQSKTWMGFQQEEIIVVLTLAKKQKVEQVMLHCLQNQDAWIFLPAKIEIYGAQEKEEGWIQIGELKFDSGLVRAPIASCQPIFTNISKPVNVKELMLKITPVKHLPDWHPGKGSPAWLFLDEIIVY